MEGSVTWPGFRGDGTSITSAADLPLAWSNEQHIAWRVGLPGYGQSSPVIHSGLVFTTSVEGDPKSAIRVDARRLTDGSLAWCRSFAPSQSGPSDSMHSRSAPTPLVDADGVYAYFETGDLVALTLDGDVRWTRPLAEEYGKAGGRHGIGNSPVQTDDALIVLVSDSSVSYLVSINKKTGKNNWKVEREKAVAWTSPTLGEVDGDTHIYVSVNGSLAAYRATDGKAVWTYSEALKGNTVASTTVAGELLLVGSSKGTSCIAVRRDAQGEVDSDSARAWFNRRAESSFASPLAYRGMAYYVNRPGEIRCVDAATGEERWEHRLPESVWASPVAAGDRLYFFGSKGTTVVLDAAAAEPTVLATNPLALGDDHKLYGVALVDGVVVIRSGVELICVRTAAEQAASDAEAASGAEAEAQAQADAVDATDAAPAAASNGESAR